MTAKIQIKNDRINSSGGGFFYHRPISFFQPCQIDRQGVWKTRGGVTQSSLSRHGREASVNKGIPHS